MSRTALIAVLVFGLLAFAAAKPVTGASGAKITPAQAAAKIAEGNPKTDSNGIITQCPMFATDGTVTFDTCSSSIPAGLRECRPEGCVNRNTKDGRKIDYTGSLNGTAVGTCVKRGNGQRVNIQCALSCGGNKCPMGVGFAYTCSNSTCVKGDKLFNFINDTQCKGSGRRDSCGTCAGKGRDLCGKCPVKGAAANATCDVPSNAIVFDALVDSTKTDDDIALAFSQATGKSPLLFAVTSRVQDNGDAVARRQRGKALLQTSTNGVVVVSLDGSAATLDAVLQAAASGSLDAASVYGVRDLSVVAADTTAATSSGTTPTTTGSTGAAHAAAPSLLLAALLALAAMLL